MIRIAPLAALLLAGCTAMEPFERTDIWRPTGANKANLAAQAANPADLARGRDLSGSDGVLAAAAIDRLHRGKVKPLQGTNGITDGATTSAAGGASLTGN